MKNKRNADKRMNMWRVSVLLFAYTTLILVVCIFSRPFAELYCRTVSWFLRYVMSFVTGFFSFSVAEVLLFALPVLWLVYEFVKAVKKQFRFKDFFRRVALVLSVLYFLFFNVFGVCYFRNSLEDNMGFELQDISSDELLNSAKYVKAELEKVLDGVEFSEDGFSVNPHDWKSMNEKIDYGYEMLETEYGFISGVDSDSKRILLSYPMTYTHISGIFMPFTAEANVNTNYPDYVVAFSTAHEKAHQRGIASEDEANFVAFLSCIASEDDYLKYSGLLSMYDYYLDEIYKTSPERYYELLGTTDKRVIREMYAYSVFFDKYRGSAASKVADTVNDTYIKAMGDTDGVESYGRVVELCTSYLIKEKALQD